MHNPIDSDLKSLLEAPLDGPSEGDDLQGEEAGCQQAGLLLATTTALVSGRPGVRPGAQGREQLGTEEMSPTQAVAQPL